MSGGLEGLPIMQTSEVQALLSFGRSVSSLSTCVLPAPSQTTILQSPAFCDATGVPSTVNI